jgi:hypothetical protein
MKIRDLSKQIAALVLGLTIMLGVGLGSAIIINAQDRYPNNDPNRRDRNSDQYGNYGGSQELRQTALNAGYDQGTRQGNYDHQNGARQSNYRNSDVYRKATQGYNSRLGDRELYRRYFREAFENGYNSSGYGQGNRVGDNRYPNNTDNRYPNNTDNRYPNNNTDNRYPNNNNQARRGRNWDGYGNFGGSPELRQTALNAGYNEGDKQGQKDHGKRNSSNYQGQAAYQKATKDYSARLGDRSIYQRYFREAYENGYSDGLNGY